MKISNNVGNLLQDADAIFIDAGGILIKPNSNLIKKICNLPNLEDEDLDKALYQHGKIGAGLGPGDDDDLFVQNFLLTAGIPIDIIQKEFHALREAVLFSPWVPREFEKTKKSLIKLKNLGKKIIVVSNTEYGGAEELLTKLHICQKGEGLGVSINGVIDSAVIGIHKPDPEIYKYTAKLFDLSIAKCVHIGDSIRNDVDSMNRAGGVGVHFCPYNFCDSKEHYHISSIEDLMLN